MNDTHPRLARPAPARSNPRAAWCAVLCVAMLSLATACTTPPDGVTPVTPFDVTRYAGKWFEVARLDHSFERGLTDVSASYRLQPDGSVEVINRGFATDKGQWKQADGKALFIGDPKRASLKVSFFGPFYGGYHVIALDQQGYRWSMVIGPNRDYLWILARDRQLPASVRDQLVAQARQLGVEVDKLIWVAQTRPDA